MKPLVLAGAAALALAGCGEGAKNGNAARPAAEGNSASAEPQGAIAEGLGNGRFAVAVRAAGLEESLRGAGPYTVLAPTDAAFAKLPQGRLDALLKPEGKEELTRLMTYHVLPGTMLAADIRAAIEAGRGKAMLATMAGGTVTATAEGNRILITGADGTKATLDGAERPYRNGVVHSIDTLLVPAG